MEHNQNDLFIFWPFCGFIESTAEDMTGNRGGES